MGERQGRTPSAVLGLGLVLGLVLGGARRLRSQIRLGPYDARGARQREGGFDTVARLMGQVQNNVRCGWMGRKTLRWDTVMRLCWPDPLTRDP